ncbi:YdcF family protein [Mycobacterium sp. 236(2023)]|uniref:YdcF family protein n=1 Tax=Mycobacterium sp. 236(2023) TaxID=3038163 RepID=UPI0024152ECB|nr:YdcF family protein [Mycobacterium sp. 236(2023)]MDG4664246.1 YdcF family protein [Mycobacterium sp. 236(2023)]
MRRRQRHLVYTSIAALVLLLFVNGASGTILFARAAADPLTRADAIVVLSGEHDGREAYGISLAEQGYAPAVLLSTPPGPRDRTMQAACQPHARIQVYCSVATPWTTRGEAIMTRQLAEKYGWKSVIVVSWRFHLPRARYIFDQCFTSPDRSVIMRDVPRTYPFTVAQWQYQFLYQYGGWGKAAIQGTCG